MRWSTNLLFGLRALTATVLAQDSCKCFPGDSCWPSTDDWDSLNATVGGRLIQTVPLGEPCHTPNYNARECQALKREWRLVDVHLNSSSSIMEAFFANNSCDPFQPMSTPCTLGNYVRYAVNASSVEDIQTTLAFAQEKNVRFVIRNTGHDYLGRSTGAGALSVWTRHLKGVEILDLDTPGYTGKAVKMGAGVQGGEVLEALQGTGLVVVGGECPTVGLAGGYTQGGGHSALSTSFGLAADNTLSWEVVLANGTAVTASPSENEDLFWALSGGGGGTYGVVTSLTVKAHPDAKIGGAFAIIFTDERNPERLFDAVQALHEELPAMVDGGAMVVYSFTKLFLTIMPVTAYGKTKAQVRKMLAPFMQKVEDLGLSKLNFYTESDNYHDHYYTYFGILETVGGAQYASRFIPRDRIADTNIAETARGIVEQDAVFIGVGTNVEPFGSNRTSSVSPGWRDAIVHSVLTVTYNDSAPYEDNVAAQDKLTNVLLPAFEELLPGTGAYVNEGDFRQPNFQDTFWGTNYERLLAIKKTYDPNNVFYATAGVGSEAWEITEDGRMCATS